MGHVLIPALILALVLVGGFLVWELYFAKRAHRAMVEQHREEGREDPPKL